MYIFESQWIYFLGFGFICSFLVEFFMHKYDAFLFYLLFPLLILLSLDPEGTTLDVSQYDRMVRPGQKLPLFKYICKVSLTMTAPARKIYEFMGIKKHRDIDES